MPIRSFFYTHITILVGAIIDRPRRGLYQIRRTKGEEATLSRRAINDRPYIRNVSLF